MSPEFQTMNLGTEQLLLSQLREHGLLEIAELGVHVRQGIAYIEGTVPNLKQKKLAGEIAKKLRGIHDVVNMLRITPLPVIDDESLKKHIRRLFARNPEINESKISVEVIDGVVYLGGFVSTAAEKRLAELEVWAASGVRDVANKIEVLSAEPKSDIQIAGEILQSFSVCLGLDLSRVTVDFREGVAHLRGSVPTDYLKEAAEELATWTPSVTGVINELKVLELPGFKGYSPPRLKRSPNEDCSQSVSVSDSHQKNAMSLGQ